jgi:hypothetical protein
VEAVVEVMVAQVAAVEALPVVEQVDQFQDKVIMVAQEVIMGNQEAVEENKVAVVLSETAS